MFDEYKNKVYNLTIRYKIIPTKHRRNQMIFQLFAQTYNISSRKFYNWKMLTIQCDSKQLQKENMIG